MKLLTTPILYREYDVAGDDELYEGAFVASPLHNNPDGFIYKWWFCRREVFDLFAVPDDAKKVWFEFHDRPAVGRYKVESLGETKNGEFRIRFDDSFILHVAGYTARLVIRRTKRDSCYVGCYYE